jgi:hypothetical protein
MELLGRQTESHDLDFKEQLDIQNVRCCEAAGQGLEP